MLLRTCRLAVVSGLMALPAVTEAAAKPPAPPVSDGSSGSFYAQVGGYAYLAWFNTDNGQVYVTASGGFVQNTVPFKVVKYNGQTLNVFNFTDIYLPGGQSLTVYGSKPALLLANQAVTIAGQIVFQTNAGYAGVSAQPIGAWDGGTGTGVGGGGGGTGGGGETQGAFCTETFTAGGGGGGGNYAAGLPGLPGTYPVDAANPVYTPAGAGGIAEASSKLQGGGGAGGGSASFGNFWAEAAGNGGGAVAFGTTSSFTITSTGLISASGFAAAPYNAGSSGHSGGGAGGDVWIVATDGFTNAGKLSARGGAGTATYGSLNCAGTVTGPGPNGGNGAGGVIKIDAATIQNNGLIDVSTGGGGTASGGFVGLTGTMVKGTGSIIGRKGHAA